MDGSHNRCTEQGSNGVKTAVITRLAARYAAKGWNAFVIRDDGVVRVVAFPEQGMAPKPYLPGLLRHGFLEDALPTLEALDGMVDDADIAYDLGICLSERARVSEAATPLERCIRLDAASANVYVGRDHETARAMAGTKPQ